jgi:serine-type D-Ala-D-Ala carboxypeptidase (penicillin-binding protein 5/6)
LIAAVLLGVALALPAAAPAPGEPTTLDRFPKAAASYLVSIDGKVVWAREPDTPRLPASLSKIMTALVLLEGDWKPESEVVISRTAAAATGSRAGLREGDKMIAGDLLTAMLVSSANDACLALAEHAAGSAQAFVDGMNEKARALHLPSTHFEDPCGHDAPQQRSSARDLLALAERALTREEFSRIVALPSATVKTKGGRSITVKTGNHLLGRVEGVEGVKSGWTPGAGKCVVVFARRGATRIFVVLLDSPDRWWTAAGLTQAAFDAARAHP